MNLPQDKNASHSTKSIPTQRARAAHSATAGHRVAKICEYLGLQLSFYIVAFPGSLYLPTTQTSESVCQLRRIHQGYQLKLPLPRDVNREKQSPENFYLPMEQTEKKPERLPHFKDGEKQIGGRDGSLDASNASDHPFHDGLSHPIRPSNSL
jgi:hypothetical protein